MPEQKPLNVTDVEELMESTFIADVLAYAECGERIRDALKATGIDAVQVMNLLVRRSLVTGFEVLVLPE